jgi:hypothetical protein
VNTPSEPQLLSALSYTRRSAKHNSLLPFTFPSVFLFVAILWPLFYILKTLATHIKGKKWVGIYYFSAAKWMWADGDAPKAIPKRFGFANLNPKPFCHCCQNAMMMMIVDVT